MAGFAPVGVLVTRPRPDADETAKNLQALGLSAYVAPLLERVVLDTPPPRPDAPFNGMVLTSANGVRVLLARKEWDRYQKLPVLCVGTATRQLAEKAGAEIAAEAPDLAGLAGLLRALPIPHHLVYPGARHLSGDLGEKLAGTGHTITHWPIYEMAPVTDVPAPIIRALDDGRIGAVLFYSKRTAAAFMRLSRTHNLNLSTKTALCLSPAIAAHLPTNSFGRTLAAKKPNEPSMLDLANAFALGQLGT